MQQVTILRTARRSFSIKEWTKAKGNKKNKANICKSQNFFLSLPCQNNSCGTDAAESPRQFLYPHFSENNMAAPCRVCGNAPGSFARMALTTRSAASLCQKILVMATTINANRTARRSFSLKEWMNEKSQFYTQICEFPVTRLLAIQINLVALCMILAAAAVEQQPAITAVAAITAAGIVYRINQTDKKQQERKGGKK